MSCSNKPSADVRRRPLQKRPRERAKFSGGSQNRAVLRTAAKRDGPSLARLPAPWSCAFSAREPAADQTPRVSRLVHQDQDIERVAVFSPRRRNETEVKREDGSARQDLA